MMLSNCIVIVIGIGLCLLGWVNCQSSGANAFESAVELEGNQAYLEASEQYWSALMKGYKVEQSFRNFLRMYSLENKLERGYLFIAEKYFAQRDTQSGMKFLKDSIDTLPTFEALSSLIQHTDDKSEKSRYLEQAGTLVEPGNARQHLHLANEYFGIKNYPLSLKNFEMAIRFDPTLDEAAAGAAYLRTNVCAWGPNGSDFEADMGRIIDIVQRENNLLLSGASVVHPHMSLAYPIPPAIKLLIAKSHASNELSLVRKHNLTIYKHDRKKLLKESKSPNFRLKVGYSSANFKSKATLYMAKDVLRYHKREEIELHVFATTAPDTERFLKEAMRGVDWRQEIANNVEYFHDVSHLDVQQQAKFIRKLGIHVLLDWDGYSNNGVRAAGLFPQQPAPIQILHQEYVGTMGAPYIQYIVTDPISSPLEYEHFYSEKFIYMPNSFLANSFGHQLPHISLPSYDLDVEDTPQRNGCGGAPVSFVFCSFNKHLKIEPSLFRVWLTILQQIDDSVMCLLEYPVDSKQNIWNFVNEFDPKLRRRVRFQPFLLNPYDNQRRVVSMCNVLLDTSVYNGHTTSYDALWGGVPVVTVSTGKDIAARVGVSLLTTLNITDLITSNRNEYAQVAVRLATDPNYYQYTRKRIIDTCLQQKPKHPLWDMARYARNMDRGFQLVWRNFLSGNSPKHVYINDVGPDLEFSSSLGADAGYIHQDNPTGNVAVLNTRQPASRNVTSSSKKCERCKCRRKSKVVQSCPTR